MHIYTYICIHIYIHGCLEQTRHPSTRFSMYINNSVYKCILIHICVCIHIIYIYIFICLIYNCICLEQTRHSSTRFGMYINNCVYVFIYMCVFECECNFEYMYTNMYRLYSRLPEMVLWLIFMVLSTCIYIYLH
jgi:hypothetical protein